MPQKQKGNNERWVKVLENRNQECWVSDQGRCKRLNKKTGQTVISLGEQLQTFSPKYLWFARDFVHRWVAKNFVKNPDPKRFTQVAHLDDNPHNNCASNLCWMSRKQNNNQPRAQRLRSAHGRSTDHSDDILRAQRGDEIRFFKTGVEAAEFLGVSRVFVYRCANPADWAQRCKGWTLQWVLLKDVISMKGELA